MLNYCSSCRAHMDFALSESGVSFDVPYLNVTEFIVEHLDRLTFPNRLERQVIFHGRSDDQQACRDSSFARATLDAIPGLDVIDATSTPEWAMIAAFFKSVSWAPSNMLALPRNFSCRLRPRVSTR